MAQIPGIARCVVLLPRFVCRCRVPCRHLLYHMVCQPLFAPDHLPLPRHGIPQIPRMLRLLYPLLRRIVDRVCFFNALHIRICRVLRQLPLRLLHRRIGLPQLAFLLIQRLFRRRGGALLELRQI